MSWAPVTQSSGNAGQRQGLQLNPGPPALGSARARGQRRNCPERSSCRINDIRHHSPCEDPNVTSVSGSVTTLKGPAFPAQVSSWKGKDRQQPSQICTQNSITVYRALLQLLNRQQTQTGHKPSQGCPSDPRTCTLQQRELGREKGMRQTEEGRGPVPSWARMACPLTWGGSPFQRKPEGLAQSPGAPGKQCSRLPSANSKAGWLSGSADLLENS